MRVEPGESKTYWLGIQKSPSSTGVKARIEGGDSHISLVEIREEAYVRRPMTQEEIDELPPHPKSIREKARTNGIREWQTLASGDGSSPITVSGGSKVSFLVRMSAPSDQQIVAVRSLVVEGDGWETTKTPLTLLSGIVNFVPKPVPDRLDLLLKPRELWSGSIIFSPAREAMASARLSDPVNGTRITRLLTFRPQERPFTPEELDELPPFSRREAQKNGYTEWLECRRVEGSGPISVGPGQLRLHVCLECTVPAGAELAPATLFVEHDLGTGHYPCFHCGCGSSGNVQPSRDRSPGR